MSILRKNAILGSSLLGIFDRKSALWPFVWGLAVLITTALLFYACASRNPATRVGDGSEYYALQIAWSETHRPYMSEPAWKDYSALQESGKIQGLVSRADLEHAFPALHLGATSDFNHFWMYPALAAGLQQISAVLGVKLSLHESFLALHALLFAIALLLITGWHGGRGTIAWIAVSLGSPVLWFTTKVHTEFFTVCLTTIAVAAAIKHRWAAASVALALASTQNISFVLPAFVACLAALPFGYRKEERYFALDFCLVSLSAVLVLAHPAYYFSRFGAITPQLVAGGASIENLNPLRALNFLFDLDVGLLPNWPLGAAFAAIGLVTVNWKRIWDEKILLIFLFAYMGSSLLAQSATENMNSGATVNVARYGLWYLCLFFPLLLGAQTIAAKGTGMMRNIVVALALFTLLGFNYSNYRPDQYENYTSPTWASTFAYSHLPGIFKPDVEIFRERNAGMGEAPIPRPSVVLGPDCRLALILTGHGSEPAVLGKRTCGMSQSGLVGLLKQRGAWSGGNEKDHYMRLSMDDIASLYASIQRGSTVQASDPPSAMRDYLISGWSRDEPWGVWSEGNSAKIGFTIKEVGTGDVHVSLLVTGFFHGAHNEIIVAPSVNDRGLPAFILRADQTLPARIDLLIPEQDALLANGRIEITLDIQSPRSPRALGLSDDYRQLGIGLIELSIR